MKDNMFQIGDTVYFVPSADLVVKTTINGVRCEYENPVWHAKHDPEKTRVSYSPTRRPYLPDYVSKESFYATKKEAEEFRRSLITADPVSYQDWRDED